MYTPRVNGHLLLLLCVSALVALSALLLSPGEGRAAAPVIAGDATASVAENTAIATVIETYTATVDSGETLTWTLEGTDAGDFNISSGGALTFSAIPDFESAADNDTNNVYNVTVKVTDDEATPLSDTLDVTITVTDVNEPPAIDTTSDTKSVEENISTSTEVLKFEATDPDSGADLTWSLTGNDADDFDITKNMDGDDVLTFDSSPDFESPAGFPAMMADPEDNTYEVTINVSDGKADDGTAETPPVSDDDLDVVVTVTDVNDPPTFDTTPANFDID